MMSPIRSVYVTSAKLGVTSKNFSVLSVAVDGHLIRNRLNICHFRCAMQKANGIVDILYVAPSFVKHLCFRSVARFFWNVIQKRCLSNQWTLNDQMARCYVTAIGCPK